MEEQRKFNKVLFVCTGNTCRSPMAETIFRSLQNENEMKTISRGMVVLFPEPSNPKAETVITSHGLKFEHHTARQLKAKDITEYTLVLTMSVTQKMQIVDEFAIPEQVYTIKEFVEEEGEVVDPYGGDLVDYENCFAELYRLVKKVSVKLQEEKEN